MNQHQSIVELYQRLCIRFRELSSAKAAGTRTCVHCNKAEVQHNPRCTLYVCTTVFRAATQEEEDRVEQSLALVEQLAKLNGWLL